MAEIVTLQDVQAEVWGTAVPGLPYNPDSAIAKAVAQLRNEGTFIGIPVTPERVLENGHVAQGFSSGVTLVWVGGDQVEIR